MPSRTERRNERAQHLGWRSYGQRRYWMAKIRLGGDNWRTVASRLADKICGGQHEHDRKGSIMCRRCNQLVNPNWITDPGAPPRGENSEWQGRLVQFAEAKTDADKATLYRRLYGARRPPAMLRNL